MNLILSRLKWLNFSLLVFVVLTAVTKLPAKAERLNPPPAVKMVQSSKEVDKESLEQKANQIITLLNEEKYDEVRKLISRDLAVELTADKIGEIWEDLIEITGPIKKQIAVRVIPSINADFVVVETQFESETDEFIVTFNKNGEIIGIDFPTVESIEEISQNMVNAVAANDFARARGYLSPALKTEILPSRLQTAWQNIQREHGLFERILDTEVRSGSSVDKVDVVIVEAKFQKATKQFFFIFDENSRIVGMDLTE
ncbi:MAG TPA: DUF3887 domain-containing protein [Cyanothece sp. UBA12306]|nr:DUF3887 domain-containing protein [Cyanothece sp. UBA12306]